MEEYDWLGLLISWLPLVLIMGGLIFFVWRMQRRGPYAQNVKEMLVFQKEGLEIQRRQAEALERLATALEKRSS